MNVRLLLALSTFALASSGVLAQSAMPRMAKDDAAMKGMDMKSGSPARSSSASHHGSGTVKAVDRQAGAVTIAHGPIASLNWPAMSMTFKLSDKDAASRLKPGDKVQFSVQQRGKDYVVTDIK